MTAIQSMEEEKSGKKLFEQLNKPTKQQTLKRKKGSIPKKVEHVGGRLKLMAKTTMEEWTSHYKRGQGQR